MAALMENDVHDKHALLPGDHDIAYGRRFVIDWKVLEMSATCLPELESQALELIRYFVGYLPVPIIYMPHENFVRALIATYKSGNLSKDTFLDEVEFYAKQIRNDDMKKGGWVKYKSYDESDMTRYHSYLSPYKQAARQRLSELMGYEPSLQHSLDAELYLRELLQTDDFHTAMPNGETDHKAVTIVRYREAFLLEGEEAADNSDLIGLLIEDAKIWYCERKAAN